MMPTHTGGRIAMFHLFPRVGKFSNPQAWTGGCSPLTRHFSLPPRPPFRRIRATGSFNDLRPKSSFLTVTENNNNNNKKFLQNESNSHKLAHFVLK